MATHNIEDLTREQMIEALGFLLHRMRSETRIALMAAHPVTYIRLYPTVDRDLVIGRVREAMDPAPDVPRQIRNYMDSPPLTEV